MSEKDINIDLKNDVDLGSVELKESPLPEKPLVVLTEEKDLKPASARDGVKLVTSSNIKEVILPYRPYADTEKWIAHRFSAASAPKAWLAMTLLILFFALGGPGRVIFLIVNFATGSNGFFVTNSSPDDLHNNQLILQWLGLVLFYGALGLSFFYLRHPTQVALNSEGISLVWNRQISWFKKNIQWNNLQRIGVEWPAGKTSPQDSLLTFQPIEGETLKFRYGAISTIEHRQQLLDAINRWAPHATRAPELSDMLSQPHTHGYTELWLQALSQPPKRERLTPLTEGALLRGAQFEIVGRLGVGGQGTAYSARSVDNNDAVVLKEFILPVYVDVNVRRQAIEKMQNEANILGKLDHPRIVKLIDFFIEDHRGYLVLERIHGGSLREIVLKSGPMDEATVKGLALQMCDMLGYLQSLEPPVVHRDFTPENLILSDEGVLKLVDFNVAQQQESTATGTVVGKHCFISPEQFRGKPTVQSDIYSMGATLYYLLTGEDPSPITSSHPQKLAESVSAEFDQIIAKMTALNTKNRYATADEIKLELE
ncbi:MAG: serine/threonine protein kinase [Leptolyngbya sp.]|nr:serine/threonine protein kinase [Candidatus Melainabacteria bacterium]